MNPDEREAGQSEARRIVRELISLILALHWLALRCAPPWGSSDTEHREVDAAVMLLIKVRSVLVRVFRL